MSEPISEIERAKWLLSGDREVTQRYPWDGIISPLQECLGDLVALCEQKDQRIAELEETNFDLRAETKMQQELIEALKLVVGVVDEH